MIIAIQSSNPFRDIRHIVMLLVLMSSCCRSVNFVLSSRSFQFVFNSVLLWRASFVLARSRLSLKAKGQHIRYTISHLYDRRFGVGPTRFRRCDVTTTTTTIENYGDRKIYKNVSLSGNKVNHQ